MRLLDLEYRAQERKIQNFLEPEGDASRPNQKPRTPQKEVHRTQRRPPAGSM
jgi:hypothetical protein